MERVFRAEGGSEGRGFRRVCANGGRQRSPVGRRKTPQGGLLQRGFARSRNAVCYHEPLISSPTGSLAKAFFCGKFAEILRKVCKKYFYFRSRPGKPNQRKGQNEKFMNFAHFCEFWCFSLGKQARFTLNFCSGMPPRKVHELAFLWFGLPGPLLIIASGKAAVILRKFRANFWKLFCNDPFPKDPSSELLSLRLVSSPALWWIDGFLTPEDSIACMQIGGQKAQGVPISAWTKWGRFESSRAFPCPSFTFWGGISLFFSLA